MGARIFLVLAAVALAGLSGCAPPVGLGFRRDAPPQALVPASLAGVSDYRARFREIFCAIRERENYPRPCEELLHRLSGEAAASGLPVSFAAPAERRRILVVPGIFGECAAHIATPFKDAEEQIRSMGYRFDLIPVSGRSSSAANARTIRDWIRDNVAPGERLLVIGYSKGTSDILETLALYPQSLPPGTAIVTVAGVVAGTPVADWWERGHSAVAQLPLPGCGPGDGEGMASITRRERLDWLSRNVLPPDRSYFSIAAFALKRNISIVLQPFNAQLSGIDAWNDGQILHHDAIIPAGYLLGYLNADHWAVTLPLARYAPWLGRTVVNRNEFPRAILLEAIVRSVEEVDAR
ncbi:MAG: hypothetical protein QOI38_557 [Sphingomonadales bacterium]|jgi:hypothetical protein|nr:hypothetical protein [Sphingomonadales bacterium]